MDSTAISSSSSAPSTLNINKKKQQQGIHSPTEVQYVPRLYSICLVGNSQCILQSNNAFVKEITTPLDSEATAISCGNDWLMILTESGKVYSFGSNIYGQLALGHEESITSVKPIAFDFSQGHKITKISCGSEHGGFILDTGALYMFGCGSYGRLGTGSFENCSTPTQIVMHWSSLIAKPLKKVVSISNAATNILSTDNSFRGKQLHQIVTQAKEADDNVVEFTDISCGERHTIVLATRNSSSITSANSSTTSKPSAKTSIISFGDGMNGRLGLGSEQDQLVGAYISQYKTVNASSIPDIVSISAGKSHNAALTSSGEVFTWGNGADGQLGHGSYESEWTPREVEFFKSIAINKIRCGAKHTLAVARSGVVYTWGRGNEGQLGLGKFASIPQPHRVAFGSAAGTSSSISPTAAVAEEVPIINEAAEARIVIRTIATKQDFCMAQDENHRLFVWGDNSAQQLGFSKTIATHFPKPKQLPYMDLRPRRLSLRIDVMNNEPAQIGLSHFDASDLFSVFLFELEASALARGANVNFGILRTASLVTSMRMETFRTQKHQQTKDPGQLQDMTWKLSLLDELKIEEIPSKEIFYYEMMKNYSVAIQSSYNRSSTFKASNAANQDGQLRKSSHLLGLPLDLEDNLYRDEEDLTGSSTCKNDKEDNKGGSGRCGHESSTREEEEEENDRKLTNENNGHRFTSTTSIHNLKGLNQWLERHNPSAPKSKIKSYHFGNAKRSFQTSIVRENCCENIINKQLELKDKPQKPVTVRTTNISKQHSAFGRTIRTASPRTQQLESQNLNDGHSTIDSSPVKISSPAATAATNCAPFGSSLKSRFSMGMWNDIKEKDEENRRPAPLLNVDKGFEVTLPRSPTTRLGNGDEFSAIIANRLMISRGNRPGPGTYTPTLSSDFVSPKIGNTKSSHCSQKKK